jgi:hypothetical protein
VKLSVNRTSPPATVYVPPFVDDPLSKVPGNDPVALEPVLVVLVVFELFFEPQPAASTASAASAATKYAKRRERLISLLPPPS